MTEALRNIESERRRAEGNKNREVDAKERDPNIWLGDLIESMYWGVFGEGPRDA